MRNDAAKRTGSFSSTVVKKALMIPEGRVTTYGRIARAAGAGPQAARSVTAILGKAYDAGETRIPFHRIVYADGTAWLGDGDGRERRKRYAREGIGIDERGKVVGFRDLLFEF